ncbi:MAG: sulfurtransferase TusA family protein [Dehalococcoidia bacterium]|nr:sulfurtransferase TusA family protein [Dehalococcoidia bacterium]
MADIHTVDARGLSCPHPAMMTREAILRQDSGVIEVLVDTATSRDNCARMAESNGWSVETAPNNEGGFRLVLRK